MKEDRGGAGCKCGVEARMGGRGDGRVARRKGWREVSRRRKRKRR